MHRSPRSWQPPTGAALWLVLVVGALLGACASHGWERRSGDAAGILARATALARFDARLARLLAKGAGDEAFVAEGGAWTSPGWRGIRERRWDELGVRLAGTSSEAFEVGVSQFPATRLRLRPRDVEQVAGELRDGRVVYPGAYGEGADAIMVASRHDAEVLILVHSPAARLSFSWDVALPTGITRALVGADGSLAFLDPRGEAVITIPAPYAIDAGGRRRAATLSWSDETRRLGLALVAEGLDFPVLIDPAFEVSQWRKVEGPTSRFEHAMAYDAARGMVVLFGGRANGIVLSTTWLWDGVTWSEASPSVTPPARSVHAMVYDPARGNVVLFGGDAGVGILGDTWLWDGRTWTKASPSASPPARYLTAMAYSASTQRVVLFGGQGAGGRLGDTWTWDGVTWTEASGGPSPAPRMGHAAVYDAARDRVVLFGGAGASNYLNDTWLWNGTTWAQAPGAGAPPSRYLHTMAYDERNGRVVLFGGSPTYLGDTWTWDGGGWTRATPATSPSPRASHAMTYDAARGVVVTTGGLDAVGRQSDTWQWSGSTWVEASPGAPPPPRYDHATAYDAARAKVVLFGGYDGGAPFADTWLWGDSSWRRASPAVSPPARSAHAMAYDAARGNVVLFGGRGDANNSLRDTWTWNGTTWTLASPGASPPADTGHVMVYDAARGNVVLFGTNGETWLWSGAAWSKASPGASPAPRSWYGMAYDEARRQVVLFGGADAILYGDTWLWDGATWKEASPPAKPPARYNHAMAYDAARSKVVLFGGFGTDTAGDTWTWDGVTWAQAATRAAPTPRYGLTLAYDGALRRTVLFGGLSMFAVHDDTWVFHAVGGSCAKGAECGSGFCVDGVCCDAPSCGTCQACDRAAPGECTPVISSPDPDTCSGAQACDAQGTCRLGLGQRCSAGAECASGQCRDGVCCDTACSGTCQACSAALKTAGPDGTCGAAKVGIDPHGDCPDDGVCQRDGQCDGAGRCRLYAKGTVCGPASCGSSGVAGALCDGLGRCVPDSTGPDCAPYVCDPGRNACANPCTKDQECVLGHYCDAGICRARLVYGDKCDSARACPLGAFCVDGVCCNSPCGGQCERCDAPSAAGSCIPVVGSPSGGRPACAVPPIGRECSAATCDGIERTSCNGFVGSLVACRAATCADGVATFAATCNGKGSCADAQTKRCAPFACGGTACKEVCADDSDCSVGNRCNRASGKCVSGATCDGAHTMTGPAGDESDCAPYKCDATGCLTTCRSVQDCVVPSVCDPSGRCVAPPEPAAPEVSGCAAARAAPAATGGALGVPLVLLVVIRAARRRAREFRARFRGARTPSRRGPRAVREEGDRP